MDFIDRIRGIAQQVQNLSTQSLNEQATKTAFIMPFLQALGYDVFNPMEVHPEFTADLPGLNGKKVDYAIMQDNKPIIFIECKSCSENLENPKHSSQLHAYFHVTAAKFSILTNGVIYRFYTDTEKPNIMDVKPFFEFNLSSFDELSVNELKRFSKTHFNCSELEDVARNLLYTREIKKFMAEQLHTPSPEFVRFFTKQVYTGAVTASVLGKFTEIIKRSLKEFINDNIKDRLESVMNHDSAKKITPDVENETPASDDNGIVTTEKELESFYIIKSILREVVDPKRIAYKDTRSYFGINIDGKVTKTICRIQLSDQKKSISILDAKGQEAKTAINSLDEIYGLSAILKDRAKSLTEKSSASTEVQI
jgi:hypothetical protein